MPKKLIAVGLICIIVVLGFLLLRPFLIRAMVTHAQHNLTLEQVLRSFSEEEAVLKYSKSIVVDIRRTVDLPPQSADHFWSLFEGRHAKCVREKIIEFLGSRNSALGQPGSSGEFNMVVEPISRTCIGLTQNSLIADMQKEHSGFDGVIRE